MTILASNVNSRVVSNVNFHVVSNINDHVVSDVNGVSCLTLSHGARTGNQLHASSCREPTDAVQNSGGAGAMAQGGRDSHVLLAADWHPRDGCRYCDLEEVSEGLNRLSIGKVKPQVSLVWRPADRYLQKLRYL